ncbi:hypothetical protein D3C72_2178630 [compost metagenome]
MMDSKSETLLSWLWAVTVTLICCPAATGCPPIEPTDTWVFWAWMAVVTSVGVSWNLLSLKGSSHTRMA